MEPSQTPRLTGYLCKDFPSRTTQSCLSLRKDEIKPNIWPGIPWELSSWRQSCQTLLKVLVISRATARVALDLLKTLSVLSDTTVRRSAVDWEDLKPYWKSEKKVIFL